MSKMMEAAGVSGPKDAVSSTTYSSSDEESDQPSSSVDSLSTNLNLFSVNKGVWDPDHCFDWEKETPTPTCILRVKRDIMTIYNEPPPGMFVVPDLENVTMVHALVTGPFNTPYEGGFFYFVIRCPPDYPMHPPRVKLMTTGDNQVRFNPNLYRTGKICLSILGTWSGPAWSPAQCISSLLISIQSLMNEQPYHNEPGYEKELNPGDCKRYNDIIRHETIRVAVCDMLEGKGQAGRLCPKALRDVMEKSFMEFSEYYESTARNNSYLTGQAMQDPFGEKRGIFNYNSITKRLKSLKEKLALKNPTAPEDPAADLLYEDSDSG